MKRFKALALVAALAVVALVGLAPTAKAMDTSYHPPVGPFQTIPYSGTDLGLPSGTVIVGNSTDTGNLIVSNGIRNLAVSLTASHAYSATLTTYIDAFGSVTEETVTATGTANAIQVLRTTADRPFASFEVTITDTSGSTGTCKVRDAIGQN